MNSAEIQCFNVVVSNEKDCIWHSKFGHLTSEMRWSLSLVKLEEND